MAWRDSTKPLKPTDLCTEQNICGPQESVIGLFKTEVIRREGPWRGIEPVEFATLDWVCWYNQRRILEPLGYVPPEEFEDMYYRNQTALATAVGVN